jgi:hypothetical protein
VIATHETLLVQTSGAAADALTPGTIQRALCTSLRLSADALGMMHPLGRGRVGVEIALPHALNLPTPMMLTVLDGKSAALFTLRRPSDPEEGRDAQLRISWSGGTRPTPGLLVRALSQATQGRFDSADLEAVFEGADWMSATVSEGLRARLTLPTSLTLDGCALTLSAHDDS